MADALVRIRFEDTGAEAGATRVANALGRLERGEPTRALRLVRGAMDELATSAAGVHPALGRLASTLTMFGIGGAVGIAAVGGLAAIALEVKALLNIVPNLENSFKKLNDEFAKIGGPGAAAQMRISAIQDRMAGLQEATVGDRIMGVLRSLGGGQRGSGALGEFETVRDISRATEGTTLRLELYRAHADAMKLHADAIKKDVEARDALRRARHISDSIPTSPLERVGADLYRRAAFGEGGNVSPLDALTGAGTTPLSNTMNAPGLAAQGRWDPGPPDAKRPSDRRNIELAVGAAMSVVSRLAQAGGAGAAVGGLGSAATALSGLKGISAGAANILGPLGIGLSALSGIMGLFGGHQQTHVIIDGYDSHALTQQQQLMLALTGFKGLSIDILSAGGDVDRILYALGRSSRTDGNMRIPPGAR
jgi:hypothetical protein